MNLFAQIRKVDEAKRLVFGRAAEEAVDKANEIMDYASSKPHFIKWSEDIAKDTDGKSLGNVRAMHGKVAAGKLTEIDFNDAEKAIDVCAKVVDDGEWKKVLEGVYTGFSIGGAYVGAKKVEKAEGGRDVTRYTAAPSEVSLVDRPCMPGARFFEIQKADGSLAKVDFQPQADESAAAADDDGVDDVTVNGSAEDIKALGKLMNEHGLAIGDLLEKAIPGYLAAKEAAAAVVEKIDEKAAEEALAKAANDAADEALAKVEAALTDALAKAGARNSAADSARIAKIHDCCVELGASCGMAAKAAPADDLAKADEADALQKLVADAVAPLQKAIADATELAKAQADKIAKLEAQPAPARIALRAVAKHDDTGAGLAKAAPPEPIKDALGDVHESAGLIKALHQIGGRPLSSPIQ